MEVRLHRMYAGVKSLENLLENSSSVLDAGRRFEDAD